MVECVSVRQPRKFGACAEIFDRDHRGTGPGGLCAGLGPTAGDIASEIKVADREYEGQKSRFFALGRRINEVSNIDSFMRASRIKQRFEMQWERRK